MPHNVVYICSVYSDVTVFCVQGVTGSNAYIATQGPLPHTVVDFLRMLWEYDIKVLPVSLLQTQHVADLTLSLGRTCS